MVHDLFSRISQQKRKGVYVQKRFVEVERPILKEKVLNLRANLKKI